MGDCEEGGTSDGAKRDRVASSSDWVFDELPPSMARRGGDPAPHAFRQSLGTFVREVIQNASDQALSDGGTEIHFDFMHLRGKELEKFKRVVGWETLERHLRAATAQAGGRELRQFMEEFDKKKSLMLLRVEDRHTVGLTGEELEGESHFRALCKDTLYSHKRGEGAGGSYGLGKSVLWAFSGLSTVLFNSNLSEHPQGAISPRLIGRAELPSHPALGPDGENWFSGPGWFGNVVDLDSGHRRAESIWADKAELVANALYLSRDADATGTSLLIVGFRDPTADFDATEEVLSQNLRTEIARHFWPALIMPGRELTAYVGTTPVVQAELGEVAVFSECYAGRNSELQVLDNEGDVVVREIPIVVPAGTDGAKAVKGKVRLIVRLAEEEASGGLVGHVARFRRPGMVLDYWSRQRIAVGMRPFHAVLACGLARCPESPSQEDYAVEAFLRAAEPPGHDEWQTTAALKAHYKRGYAKALTDLKTKVQEELRKLVVAQPRHGTKGPERLLKRFPIGSKGGKRAGAKHAFHFPELSARFEDGRWRVDGAIEPAGVDGEWHCTIQLAEVGEDGAVALPLVVEAIEAREGTCETLIKEGDGVLRAKGPKRVQFHLMSSVLEGSADQRGQLKVDVVGSRGVQR